MNMNEIATAVRHKIPIIEVVINNHVLGMVRQWQDLFYDERYSATVLRDAVDFAKLAEAMGRSGNACGEPGGVQKKLLRMRLPWTVLL